MNSWFLVLPDKSEVKLNENSSVEFNKFLFYFNRNIKKESAAHYAVSKGAEVAETHTSDIGTRNSFYGF